MDEEQNLNNKVLFDRSKENQEESELTHNEIWDDTLLIQHYDETMNKARRLLANRLSSASSLSDSECSNNNSHRTEVVNGFPPNKGHASSSTNIKKKKKKKGRKKNEWHTGDLCRARYSEDGHVYEATIVDINNATSRCTVRYLGYNNHEEVAQSSLLKTKGEGARKKQMKEAIECYEQNESTEESCSASDNHSQRNKRFPKPYQMPYESKTSPTMHSPSAATFPHLPDLPPPPALGFVNGSDPISSEALHTMLMSWYMTGYHTGYYQGLNQGRKCSKNN